MLEPRSRSCWRRKGSELQLEPNEHYYLLSLGEGKCVGVVSAELHKPHVGRLGEFGDDARRGEHLEHGLHRHDGVAVRQVVLLCTVGRLLIHHHHCIGEIDRGSDEVVQTRECQG